MDIKKNKITAFGMFAAVAVIALSSFLGKHVYRIVNRFSDEDIITSETMGQIIFILFGFLFVLVVVVVSLIINSRQRKQRHQDLLVLAQRNGWIYKEKMDLPFLKEFHKDLDNGWREHSKLLFGESSNILTGRKNNRNIYISDQTYTTGGNQHRTFHIKTITAIELDEAQLPIMCLYPEGFLDTIWDGLTRYDIDFAQFPVFSKKYILYGKNEKQIRDFFDPQILTFYEQQPPFITICGGKYLLIYGDGLLNAAEIEAQINFLFSLADLFLKR